jgi:predicted RNA-binding protein (virulence factor B family)
MLKIGNRNNLKIIRLTATGACLESSEGDILLPARLVPASAVVGDVLEVFVYVDSEGRLTATTRRPRAEVGEFALLPVRDVVPFGAFLDWGLEKDLLLPLGEQSTPAVKGGRVMVRLYLHESGRVAASTKLDKFLSPVDDSLVEGDEVELFVYAYTELGAKVVINNRFAGLLFGNELVVRPGPGERFRGYVKKIRPDGKVDVTLRKGGAREAAEDRETLLRALISRDGVLPLHDKSSPEEIASLVRLSKKSFKRAVGGLYKEGLIDLGEGCITLRERGEK